MKATLHSSGTLLQQPERSFPEVIDASQSLPPASHEVEDQFVMNGPAIASQFYHLDGEKLVAAWNEFAKMDKKEPHGTTSP